MCIPVGMDVQRYMNVFIKKNEENSKEQQAQVTERPHSPPHLFKVRFSDDERSNNLKLHFAILR
jgi:hypothetical protein